MRTLPAVLVVVLIAGWLAGLTYPLLETTEGRYASVSEAMVRTGNWLDPQFNGRPHFTKPPLAYWAGAASIAVLGPSEFAARLPATLALAACVLLVFVLARRLGLGGAGRGWAVLMAAASPLAVAQGRIASSDIFLWIGVLLFYLGLLEARSRRRAVLTGTGLGWGFLAKGPVILLWTLLPMLVLRLVDAAYVRLRRGSCPVEGGPHWSLAGLKSPPGLVLALVLGLSWYLVEVIRHPDLVSYWLGSEVSDRFLTTSHGREEPFWYFLVLLPGIVLPWLPEMARGVVQAWRRCGPWMPVLYWVLIPVILLSFSGSKRPNYLLPAIAPLALLGGLALDHCSWFWNVGRGLRVRTVVWVVLVLLSPVVFHLGLAVPGTRDAAAVIRERGQPVVLYRTVPSSLPFYLRRPVPTIQVNRRDPFDVDLADLVLEKGELAGRLKAGWLILVRNKDLERLNGLAPGPLVVVWEGGKHLLLALPPASSI